jgi:hypothetical protein
VLVRMSAFEEQKITNVSIRLQQRCLAMSAVFSRPDGTFYPPSRHRYEFLFVNQKSRNFDLFGPDLIYS